MAKYFRRSLLAWLWLCAAGIAGEISLRGNVQVDHAVVRLGDVAEIYGLDEPAREKLLAVELLPAPNAGQVRKLTVREVQEAVARNMPELAAWTFGGSSETTVTRTSAIKARKAAKPRAGSLSTSAQDRIRDQIEQAMLSYVRERLGEEEWSIEVEVTTEQFQLFADASAIRVTGGRYVDEDHVQFRVETGDAGSGALTKITARVTLPPMIVVAKRELARGETVAEQDVELVRGEEKHALQKPLEALDDVIGKEMTRTVAAGQPITAPSVRSVLLVRRGQVVTVYSRCGGVQIRVTGRAKEDGAHGDLVPVESIASRETFHARVSGPQEVEIYAASNTTPTVEDTPREPTPWLAAKRQASAAAAKSSARSLNSK